MHCLQKRRVQEFEEFRLNYYCALLYLCGEPNESTELSQVCYVGVIAAAAKERDSFTPVLNCDDQLGVYVQAAIGDAVVDWDPVGGEEDRSTVKPAEKEAMEEEKCCIQFGL
jgi:hypothetical protein